MEWQTLGAFLAATVVLLLTPGPVMAIVVANTVTGGRAAGLWTVAGIALGEIVLVGMLVVSLLWSIRVFAGALPWFSLAGAAYLMWLAATALRAMGKPLPVPANGRPRPFLSGLAVSVSNPAALLFYAALFMSFVERERSLATQLGLLAMIYLGLTLAFDFTCVFCVGWFRRWRMPGPSALRAARFCCALVYLGTAALAVGGFVKAPGAAGGAAAEATGASWLSVFEAPAHTAGAITDGGF